MGNTPITQLQLYRMVKSLAWRRKMAERLEELESGIMDYMLEKNSNQIVAAGYLVELAEEKLVLEKLPYINQKQLKLNFTEEKRENYRGKSSSIENVLGNDYKKI